MNEPYTKLQNGNKGCSTIIENNHIYLNIQFQRNGNKANCPINLIA